MQFVIKQRMLAIRDSFFITDVSGNRVLEVKGSLVKIPKRFAIKDVNGNDLLALGYQGKAIGETLNALLEGVLDETLPNERQALLDRAKQRVANDGISSE